MRITHCSSFEIPSVGAHVTLTSGMIPLSIVKSSSVLHTPILGVMFLSAAYSCQAACVELSAGPCNVRLPGAYRVSPGSRDFVRYDILLPSPPEGQYC